MSRRPRFWAVLVAAAIVVVGLPAAVTGAYLSTTTGAQSASALGTWCSVPDSGSRKNVYPLSTFATADGTRMMIVPVTNSAQFAPVEASGAEAGRLGVRLWSCADTMPTGTIKATAWRGTRAPVAAEWSVAPAGAAYASARLNPASGLGADLKNLHRTAAPAANVDPTTGVAATTGRYSWLLDSTRNSGSKSATHPGCAAKSCVVAPAAPAAINASFSGSEAAATAGAVRGNSTTYLASKYYVSGGAWPAGTVTNVLQCRYRLLGILTWSDWADAPAGGCEPPGLLTSLETRTDPRVTEAKPTVSPTVLTAGGTPSDTTGTQTQWVVLEWTGSAIPENFEVEVFVG